MQTLSQKFEMRRKSPVDTGVQRLALLIDEIYKLKEETIPLLNKLGPALQDIEDKIAEVNEVYASFKAIKKGDPGSVDEQKIISQILALMPPPIPGKNANPEEVVPLVLEKIPPPEKVNIEKLANAVIGLLPPQKENLKVINITKNEQVDPALLLEAFYNFLTSKKGKRLGIEHIEGLDQAFSTLRNQVSQSYPHGGGVPSLAAGTNIVLTRTADGGYSISSLGGGSVTVETPSGTVNTSNTVFTVLNTPKYIVVDGLNKYETLHYTYVAGTITITDGAPPVQYIRSIY